MHTKKLKFTDIVWQNMELEELIVMTNSTS
jgi:protein tyrosine phosphatase